MPNAVLTDHLVLPSACPIGGVPLPLGAGHRSILGQLWRSHIVRSLGFRGGAVPPRDLEATTTLTLTGTEG